MPAAFFFAGDLRFYFERQRVHSYGLGGRNFPEHLILALAGAPSLLGTVAGTPV